MTKEEAEKELSEYTAKPLGFCPVIKSTCRLDCVSYVVPRVASQYKDVFFILKESCASPLVTGDIETYAQ